MRAEKQDWIVLGSRDHGVSWGPMPKGEALQFAAAMPERTAVSLEGASSDMYTALAYGLDYKPMERSV